MSALVIVLLTLVGVAIAYVVIRAALNDFAQRHYMRGLDNNEAVENWRRQVQSARDMADIAWRQALVWRKEVVALNNAQRRLRRRLLKNRPSKSRNAVAGSPSTEESSK